MRYLSKHVIVILLGLIFFGVAAHAILPKDTGGKLRIFSRTSQNGADSKKRDTFILWSDSVVGPEEEFDTVVIMSGKVSFHGKAKDLVILGGEVSLQDDARVDGSLVVLGGKLHKRDAAKVTEQVLFELPSHLPKWIGAFGPILSFVYSDSAAFLYVVVRAVFICLFGALLYVIAPELMREAEMHAQKKPLHSVCWSFIGMVIFVPGVVMLLISIVGIMFIPLFVMFYCLIYYFCAYVMTANILGHLLPPRDSIVMPPLRFFYGVFILILISYVPTFGSFLIYLGMLFTSGALFYTIVSRVRGRSFR